MIDSLFDLIAAAFIASLPVLIAIIRSRRRRRTRKARSSSVEGRREKESVEEPFPEVRRAQPRGAHASRTEEPELDQLGAVEKRERQGGKKRLIETTNRYSPLQRAIVLKEILGGPKGLE